jgi:dipeptidyl aminopeptidase/acylaminoacyl peptidase
MPVAPYGSWPSPITSDFLVQQVVSLSEVLVDDGSLWWIEGRPQEAGRQVVVRRDPSGRIADVLPEGFSARTRVHEYGGGAYLVHRGVLFFSNLPDQRLWRLDPGEQTPRPVTPEPPEGTSMRYADGVATPDGRWIVCVRERHLGDQATDVVNDLVAVPAAGEGEPVVLAEGHDFYAAPRLDASGRRLAWLCWDHPNMPWDGTELWVADVGAGMAVDNPRRVAGGPDESISQPRWSPDGLLHWISDRTGWWNLYADEGSSGSGRALAPMAAEFARPDWVFGQSSYTFLADGRLVATWSNEGLSHLGFVGAGLRGPNAAASRAEEVAVPFTELSSLQPYGDGVAAIAASASRSPAVVSIALDTGAARVIRAGRSTSVPAEAISEARRLAFPTEGEQTAHAFYYPPRLEGFEGQPEECPPLLVRSHGGPTAAASPALNVEIQFWTSRGFAVVDVNYGGSTGYGREYRRRLDGRWGVVDVDDCVNAALYLARVGEADARRLVVRGGSAGGYTTLCALAYRDVFAAGASYYGVADLETLATDTHKFESRYLDRLVGPYPESRDLFRERSPIDHADGISVPLIILQGLEDAVVSPRQAEALVNALRANGVPFAYLTFEGEQHGFRQASTIRRAAEAELWFYGEVLGFEPADRIEPAEVEGPLAHD